MRSFCRRSADICSLLVCTSAFMDSLTAAAQRRNTPLLTFKKQTNLFCHRKNLISCSPSVCVALGVLGLVSWLVSELRVARGLATGAVERSEELLVQRRVNCRVGPWEKLSNGGKHYKKRGDHFTKQTWSSLTINMTNNRMRKPYWSIRSGVAKWIKANSHKYETTFLYNTDSQWP